MSLNSRTANRDPDDHPYTVEAHDCRYEACAVCGATLETDQGATLDPIAPAAAAEALESAWSAALAAFRLAIVSAKAAGLDTDHEEAYVGQIFDPSCRMFATGSVDTHVGWVVERLRGGYPYGDKEDRS